MIGGGYRESELPEEPPRKRSVADLDTAFGALGAKAAEREERFRQARAAEATG